MDIMSMTPEELERLMVSMGEKAFRGKQIFTWLHARGASTYDEMTELPLSLRSKLEIYPLGFPEILTAAESEGADKYLFKLANETIIESVLMSYSYGGTVCVSSQAGCKMGCAFCASGVGFDRDLTAGEMCGQVYAIAKVNKRIGVSRVVVMGSGEPLANYGALIRFINLITNEQGRNISGRHITVSTCGIVPKIYELAMLKLQITLAVSLHAPDDETRRRIMPSAKVYSVQDIVKAAKFYADHTKRRVTFEYAMIDGLNDAPIQASKLGTLLRGGMFHVNLIPLNPVSLREGRYAPSPRTKIQAFAKKLEACGVEATVRRSLGSGVNAACGQLAWYARDTEQEKIV